MAKKLDPTKEDSSYPLYRIPFTDQPIGGKTAEPSAESVGVPGIKKMIYDHSDLANFPLDIELTVIAGQELKAAKMFDSGLPTRDIIVKANSLNTGMLYVGGLSCTYPLNPGEGVVLAVRDLFRFYWKGDTVGDKLHILAEAF